MAVTKKIEIDGQMVEFRASAAVPRLYRIIRSWHRRLTLTGSNQTFVLILIAK